MSADGLSCGCADSNVRYFCMYCDNVRCEEHRDNQHFCPECPGCGFRHGYPVHEWDAERRKLTVAGGRRRRERHGEVS